MVDKADWVKNLKKPLYDLSVKELETLIKFKLNMSNSLAVKTTNALRRYFKECRAKGIIPKSDLRTIAQAVKGEVTADNKDLVKSELLEAIKLSQKEDRSLTKEEMSRVYKAIENEVRTKAEWEDTAELTERLRPKDKD